MSEEFCGFTRGTVGSELYLPLSVRRGTQTFHFIFDAQLAPLEFCNLFVLGGRPVHRQMEFLLQRTMLLFKRCKMSFNCH